MESDTLSFNPVKVELNAVCHGCLSSGRILKPLQDNAQMFLLLLSRQSLSDCKNTSPPLCWECAANLRRIKKFQNRIQNAQWILQQSQYLLIQSTTTLSTLTTVRLNKEIRLEHGDITNNFDNSSLNFDDTLDVKDVICKEETTDFDVPLDDYVQYSDTDINERTHIKQEAPVLNLKEEKNVNKTKGNTSSFKKNYARKAKIALNPDIDLSKPENYYGKAFVSAMEIEEMIKREDKRCSKKKRFNCKECKRGYKSTIHLKRHQTFQHAKTSGPFKCLECNASCASQPELRAHWDEHNYVLKCHICDRRMTQRNAMLRHISFHSHTFTCLVCQRQFNYSKDFSKHYQDLHKRLTCNDCGLNFTNKNSILKHIRRHHAAHRCLECNKEYKTYKNLKSHYSLCHPALVQAAASDSSLSYCVECDRQFESVSRYKRHLQTATVHTPPKKISVPCPGCEKVFSRKNYMKNHYKLFHAGKTKHYCSICDKYLITAHALRKHQQFVHEKVAVPKNKMCDICGRGFSTNRILIHHRRTHTGERPHQCPHCAAAFAQDVALKTHLRTQHKHAINS